MRKRGNIPVIFATGMPTKTPLGNTVYCIVLGYITYRPVALWELLANEIKSACKQISCFKNSTQTHVCLCV